MKKIVHLNTKLLSSYVYMAILVVFLPCAAVSYENLSPSTYQVTIDYGIMVPMRDGIRLAANIARPTAEGKYPALVALSPYGKDVATFFAQRGYVAVFAELRGTGRSEGAMVDYFIGQQWNDGHDLVEWVAQQPWCDGKVGMYGTSWLAILTTRTAATRPPHLKAIAVNSSYANFFGEHFWPGGISHMGVWTWHSMANTLQTMLRGPVYDNPSASGKTVDTALWEYHIANNGWKTFPPPIWENDVYNDFWKDKDLRSKYATFDTPTLQVANYFDHMRNHSEAYQNYMVLKEKNIPQKLVVGPWSHGARGSKYLIDSNTLYLAWFDYMLKGIDTGIMDEPPIAIFVMRENKWRFENEWPIARTEFTNFYFTPSGGLTDKMAEAISQVARTRTSSLSYKYIPWVGIAAGPQSPYLSFCYDDFQVQDDNSQDDALSLTFTSEVLKGDLEVTGMPQIRFYASSTANDTNFVVKLEDVQPDGTSVMITRGWLNSSYRDSNLSPFYPEQFKFVTPTSITPGAVYEYSLTLTNTSYVFKAGSRIRIAISSSDWPSIWPNPNQAVNTLHLVLKDKNLGKGNLRNLLSTVVLPIVPKPEKALPEPQLPSAPDMACNPANYQYWVDDNVINNTITVNYSRTSTSQDGLGKYKTNQMWQAILPKNRPQDHEILFSNIWIMDREGAPDIKATYSYIVDQNGPAMNFQYEYGGPF